MPLKKLEVIQSLKKKGFKNIGGDHKYLVYHTIDGKQTNIKTKVSRGSYSDIADKCVNEMKRQCRLDKKADFIDLVKCPLERDDYEAILRAKGFCD